MKQGFNYVFVHGLSGWGSYDEINKKRPYWRSGTSDLTVLLSGQGYSCYAASVDPTGSAWDRACDLYAQIAGTRVDYGAAHSKKYRHERFGKDFTGNALIPKWDQDTKLVLLGHSFGGVTVRLFAELLANGDPEEREAGAEDTSDLFTGGMSNRIHSIVTIASPTNGTTAYDLYRDPKFHPKEIKAPWWSRKLASSMKEFNTPKMDGRDERDYANYDMLIDSAQALNCRISNLPEVYYLSIPCAFTNRQKDGTQRPKKKMEPFFVLSSCHMGAYTGKTASGMIIDESWRENDGLVNTVSAMYPIGAPSKPYEKGCVEPGIWNVFPPYDGDHASLTGGIMKKHDVYSFYQDLLQIIDGLS